MYLLDTNIAIYLRDRESTITERVADLATVPQISMMSWIELENGVVRDATNRVQRRKSLDVLLPRIIVLDVDHAVGVAYRGIVEQMGYSRSRIADRIIAATALAHDLTCITINGPDFREIPNLKLEIWPAPSAQ